MPLVTSTPPSSSLSQRVAIRLLCFVTLLTPALHAQSIVENFNGYPGSAGSGWAGGWGTSTGAGGTGSSGTATASASASSASPLKDGGSYLSFTGGTSATGDRTQYNSSASRRYGSFAEVNTLQDHVITFDFRIDSLTGFDSSSDFVGIFGQTGATFSNNFNNTSSWAVRVFAGEQTGGTPAYAWMAHDGDRAGGSYSGGNLVALRDGGGQTLVAEAGIVYSVTVINRVTAGTYDVYVTDGSTTVSATGLGYRTANWGANAVETPAISFQSQVNETGNSAAFSVDSIHIGTSQIPEPSTAGLLIGVVALGFACRQNRRTPRGR